MTNEFLLQDRIQKIQQIIRKYGEENFYISFSGGKDSTVLSALIDLALPNNKIPRVYANTGIEYRLIVDFVERERETSFMGTCGLEAYKANQANPRRGRLSIQKQIPFNGFVYLSTFGRHRIGQRVHETERATERDS